MFRGRRRRLGCTGRVCKKSCASWEFGGRGENQWRKNRNLHIVAENTELTEKNQDIEIRRMRLGNSEMRLGAYVLAGGGSTRFGRDKALVEFAGKPMLARMIELMRTFA